MLHLHEGTVILGRVHQNARRISIALARLIIVVPFLYFQMMLHISPYIVYAARIITLCCKYIIQYNART